MSRVLSTIRTKAMAVVFALTGALVAFLVTYFPARQLDSMRGALRDKSVAYARLVSEQVRSGVAFEDRETVREVFTATAQDHDVRGLALLDASDHVIFALGEFAGRAAPPTYGNVDRVRLARGETFLRAVAPVVSREGPTGTLVLELSTERLEAERRTVQRTAIAVGLGALGVGFVAAWLIARSLGARLGAIARATRRVADGDLSEEPVHDPSADEVGQLARSFNAMRANLRALVTQIRETAERENERLDRLVRERTLELDARNRDMRLVLDNVDQGLLVLDRQGRPLRERSAIVDRWFGAPAPGAPFGELLGRVDPRFEVAFASAWGQLLDGFLPAEVAMEMLPSSLVGGGREVDLRYSALRGGGDEGGLVLVVASDVTERRRLERAEGEEREVVRAFERALRDRRGFLEFLDETQARVTRLCGDTRPSLVDLKRDLHTIKGNASLAGLARLARLAHELEDSVAGRGGDLVAAEREMLRSHWGAFAQRLGALLGERSERSVTIAAEEYQATLRGLIEGRSRSELARSMASWRLEEARDRLDRIAEQASALAERLGEQVVVHVDAGGVRLSTAAMAGFWSAFGHAVRNAVSHGLEAPEERARVGKGSTGHLWLRAHRSAEAIVVAISDDGRGIDWETVRARAIAMGLPASTEADLHDALFHDGLSTRDRADDVAGRGVGMGVLRAECERLGGRVEVASTRGRGTTVSFTFAARRVAESEETRAVARPGAAAHSRPPMRASLPAPAAP